MNNRLKSAFAAILLYQSVIVPSFADEIQIPINRQGSYLGNIERPSLGQKQQQVLEQYGQPTQEHPATGTPAIIRWDYPNFTVYFENTFVLHSVLKHRRSDSEQ